MSTMPRPDVAVVGLGPVGAVAALLLARSGLRVAAWDRREMPGRQGRAVALDGEAVDVLRWAGLGTDWTPVRAAADAGADGLVAVVTGAGHTPPAFLEALLGAAARMPVVVTVRPERGAILRATYGFEGAEGDLRAGALVPAGALPAQHARIKLMACLGAGLEREAIAAAFAPDDP